MIEGADLPAPLVHFLLLCKLLLAVPLANLRAEGDIDPNFDGL